MQFVVRELNVKKTTTEVHCL